MSGKKLAMVQKKIGLPKSWQPKPLPKTLGESIDAALAVRTARKELEAVIKQMESDETRIEEHIIASFKKSEIEGARGKHGTATLKEKDVPKVVDWDAFYAHIRKTGSFELLQRRPGEGACQERWEAKESIPGVEKFHKVDLHITEGK